jgi:predicted HAD superfamily Cof-like phosphohydrolase
VTTDLLPELRSLLAAQPPGSGAHDTLERAVAEIERLRSRRSFQEQVAEFHRALDFPVRETPTVPGDDEVRLRARLIAEEAFEVLAAMFPKERWISWYRGVREVIDRAHVDVYLPALAHELADLHYVTSGTAVQLGIGEGAVLAEVHRANCEKRGGGKDAGGKALRPANWRPADVAAVLRAQGWDGGEEPR